MLLGVCCHGRWETRDSFLLGVTPAGCEFQDPLLSKLGYFFSPNSTSIIGRDGTNLSWPRTLQAVWLKQLQENGDQFPRNNHRTELVADRVLSLSGGKCSIVGMAVGIVGYSHIGLSEARKLAVLYKPSPYRVRDGLDSNMWLNLGELPWVEGPDLSAHDWRLTIVFKPRHGTKPRPQRPTGKVQRPPLLPLRVESEPTRRPSLFGDPGDRW